MCTQFAESCMGTSLPLQDLCRTASFLPLLLLTAGGRPSTLGNTPTSAQLQHCVQQSHMGNTPSPKQQQQYQETLASMTAASKEAKESTSSSQEEDEVVDPVVTNRMLSRVFVFAGLPVLFGLLLYPFFWYLQVCMLPRSTLIGGSRVVLCWATGAVWHAGDAEGGPADGIGFRDTVDHFWGRSARHLVRCYVCKLGSI